MIARALTATALLLAGCEAPEPYRRTDAWNPTGANSGNIAAMVAQPADLVRGRGVRRTDARQSAEAIDRLWTGRSRPLPAANSTAPQAAAPPATGAPN